jgi:serine phosphatase RsbU (regulator of sigma subunit)
LEPSGPPIGLFTETEYQSDTLQTRGGERVMMLTDGTYEWDRPQGDPPDGGWKRLLAFLSDHRTSPPADLWAGLMSEIHTTSGPNLEDDCTLVTIDILP